MTGTPGERPLESFAVEPASRVEASPDRSRLLTAAMLAIASGSVLVPLNSTMLAVALPRVMTDFSVGAPEVASLVTLYLGSVAVALPASGSLGDRFGHRRTFLVGVVGFGLASTLAAIAWAFPVLAVSRVLQAVSGSFVSTSSVALVRAAAPADRRGEAFGLFDMLVSVAAAIGPLVGGLIVGAFGWRALFFVAAPVALIAAIAVGLVVRPGGADEPEAGRRPIDVPGLVALAAVIVALVMALRGGGGPLPLIGVAAVIPLVVLFVAVELRTPIPAVDPRLFGSLAFATAVVGVFGATVVLHGSFVLVPILIETVRGSTPEVSGLALLGVSAFWAVIAPFGGRVSDTFGRRLPSVVGMVITALGLAALIPTSASASPLVIAGLMSVVGLGMGLSGAPRQAAAMDSIDPGRVGMAAGTYYTGRYLGGVLGASLAGAVLGSSITAGAVSVGFAWLAVVAISVAIVSFGLPRAAKRA